MSSRRNGVLPRQELERLIDAGYIKDVAKDYLNPSSIDLPLSDEAYELECALLPCRQHVRVAMQLVGAKRHDLSKPLARGKNYLIRVDGTWHLPESLYAYANPKSSTGRVNVLVRLVADGEEMYDKLSSGFSDEVWVLVRPDSFPVRVAPGLALTQLRFFSGKAFINKYHSELAVERTGLIFNADRTKRSFSEIYQPEESFILTLSVDARSVGSVEEPKTSST